MKLIECKDETEWVAAVNAWIISIASLQPFERLFLPAGETPRPLYRSWETQGAPFADSVKLVQLDEIISGRRKNAFQFFLKKELPSFQNQFEFINTAERGAEVAILGLGLNGHVALHEPGVPLDFYSGCLRLNPDTVKQNQLSPTDKVITYGLGAILRARAILLIVRGEQKRVILQKILLPDCKLPAAHLKTHAQLTIISCF